MCFQESWLLGHCQSGTADLLARQGYSEKDDCAHQMSKKFPNCLLYLLDAITKVVFRSSYCYFVVAGVTALIFHDQCLQLQIVWKPFRGQPPRSFSFSHRRGSIVLLSSDLLTDEFYTALPQQHTQKSTCMSS